MQKIQTGDEVIVIAGKDKGRTGKVLSVDTESSRVIVENINVAKKRPRSRRHHRQLFDLAAHRGGCALH